VDGQGWDDWCLLLCCRGASAYLHAMLDMDCSATGSWFGCSVFRCLCVPHVCVWPSAWLYKEGVRMQHAYTSKPAASSSWSVNVGFAFFKL
jgi:hypothetical protein